MTWTVISFGKHRGKTLPQIILDDPLWFFWVLPKLYGRLKIEADDVARKASKIKIRDETLANGAFYNGTTTDGASPNGVSNLSELVGDFTNPILKPEAAEVVKQHGEISKKKLPILPPATSVGPAACPSCFGTSVCKCCNRNTKSRSFMQMITMSGTCA
jgi:hypothetical protein